MAYGEFKYIRNCLHCIPLNYKNERKAIALLSCRHLNWLVCITEKIFKGVELTRAYA